MPATFLEQLKGHTVVVADTGDFQSIKKFRPRDATTNPSLIAAAAKMPEYASVVDEALKWAKKEAPGEETGSDMILSRSSGLSPLFARCGASDATS